MDQPWPARQSHLIHMTHHVQLKTNPDQPKNNNIFHSIYLNTQTTTSSPANLITNTLTPPLLINLIN
jgi:hypothetical protein